MDKSALDYAANGAGGGVTAPPAPGAGFGETSTSPQEMGPGPLPTGAAQAAPPPAQPAPGYDALYSVPFAMYSDPTPSQMAQRQPAPVASVAASVAPSVAASVAPSVGDAAPPAGDAAPLQAAGLEDLAQRGVPIASENGGVQMPRLPDKGLTQARARARSALTLGVLEAHHGLCEAWDYVHPSNAPYVDPKEGGKPYETLDSFFNREKGRAAVITVSTKTADMGAAILDSLYRVVLAASDGRLQYREDSLQELQQWCLRFGGEGAAVGGCRRADCAIVAQLAALYRRTAPHRSRYGGLDIEVLDTIMKNDPSGRASQAFDRWGLLLAQAYVDLLRFLGQQAMALHWEKKTTLSPELLAGLVRMLPMVTGVQLPYDAVTALWAALD